MAWPACQSRPGNLCPGWLRAAFLQAGRGGWSGWSGLAPVCPWSPSPLGVPHDPQTLWQRQAAGALCLLAVNMICWQNPGMAGGRARDFAPGPLSPRPSGGTSPPRRSAGSLASPGLACTPVAYKQVLLCSRAPVTVQMQS